MAKTFQAAILLCFFVTIPTIGQSPANQVPENLPKFDAISIKLHNGGPNSGLNLARPGGHVQLTADLRELMILANNLHSLSEAIALLAVR